MTDRSILVMGLMWLGVSAAFAQTPALSPPLSRYGPLRAPALQTRGLAPEVRQAVEMALIQSAEASTKAIEAEVMIRAARRMAGNGREAARAAEQGGRGDMPVSFDHMRCRFSGEEHGRRPAGLGVMVCGPVRFEGRFRDGMPDGLVVADGPEAGYVGQYRNGRRDGLGGDFSRRAPDAYEGEYRNGLRQGLGIERDKDGFYPGRYGFYAGPGDRQTDMELSGTQDFPAAHWAGTFGAYAGPRIACKLIKGAVLEGSVLDQDGAKFDARGRVIEQGQYKLGILQDGKAPPC